MKKNGLILLIFTFFFLLGFRVSRADNSCLQNVQNACGGSGSGSSSCTDQLNQCLSDTNKAIDELNRALAPNIALLNNLQAQIKGIKDRVATIENEIGVKRINIDKGYAELAKQKDTLNTTIANYYIKSYYSSPLIIFLANPSSAVGLVQNLAFQRALANQDREKIINFALLLTDLENQKKELENEGTRLTAVKAGLDQQSAKLDTIVSSGKAYQSQLQGQLAQLSSIQQQVLGQRLSALGIPLYATSTSGCIDDRGKDPGFSPKFAFFTYGVPNRVGLSQYGAKGRADAGEPYDTILHAYYNFDGYRTIDPNSITIKVNDSNGYNSGNIIWTGTLDQYIRRIYEVPENWPAESLKAQIIAATSYVLAETNDGNMSICANTHCQVFQTNEKGGGWGDAVSAIESQGGMKSMTKGGQTIIAWFSSTHGGYIHSSGGDIGGASWTKDAIDTLNGSVSGWDDLKSNAFDRGSPWFYCDWGGRGQNNTAFLRSEELADIANVIMLVQASNGDPNVTKHLYQTDKSDPNPSGTDTWSADRVKQELQRYPGYTPFDSVSSADITSADFSSGRTNTVSINGRGFPGDLFKTYFNLRAPANIQIVGPLYNIERQ